MTAPTLTREDTITLIIEHMVNQGIDDSQQFVEYMAELLTFDNDELANQLDIVEELGLNSSTMPRF